MTSSLLMIALLCVVSFVWWGPALWAGSLAARRGHDRALWFLLLVALTPLGWLSAINATYARAWMIPAALAAPFVCALTARLVPAKENISPYKKSWLFILGVMAYGSWTMVAAAQYKGTTMAAGSNQSATIGNLGSLRSALSIYYGDNKTYPTDLNALDPRYLTIPATHPISTDKIIFHLSSSKITNASSRRSDDRGGWGYVNTPQLSDGSPNPEFGTIFVNCTHPDTRNEKTLSDY